MIISNTLRNQIYIGYDAREHAAWEVCDKSIRDFHLKPKKLRTQNIPEYTRNFGEKQSTDFTFSRFWLPYLCGYEGFSMFVDCDFLFLKNPLNVIHEIDTNKAVSVVKHLSYVPKTEKKMDNIDQNVYYRKNWSSFMVFNNEHPEIKKLTPCYLNTHRPGLDFHQFEWLDDKYIGSLSLIWNVLDGYYHLNKDEIGAVHYTDGGPWFEDYQETDYSEIWKEKERELMSEKKEYPVGWECPRCGSVNAPQKDKCKCIKTESTDQDPKQFLTE